MENGRCKSPKHRFPSLSTAFQELNLKPPYTGSSALLPLLQTPLGRSLPSIYPKIHVMDLPIGTLFRTPSLSAHARCLSLTDSHPQCEDFRYSSDSCFSATARFLESFKKIQSPAEEAEIFVVPFYQPCDSDVILHHNLSTAYLKGISSLHTPHNSPT